MAIETRTGTKRLVNGGNNDDEKDGTNCNNPQMRRIILKVGSKRAEPPEMIHSSFQNLVVGDAVGTKSAIHSELRAKLGGDYIVLCSTQSPTLSFAADSTTNYCIEGHQVNLRSFEYFFTFSGNGLCRLPNMKMDGLGQQQLEGGSSGICSNSAYSF